MKNSQIWYVQKKGKADGPHSLEDVRNQIRQGQLQGHDLVYLEGADAWKRAFDWPEIGKEIFNEQRTAFEKIKDEPKKEKNAAAEWVVLVRFEEAGGLKFRQDGPHTTQKIRELLREGKIQSSDHLWKKGFEQWVPVYQYEEFSPSLWNVQEETLPHLEKVEEIERKEDVVSKVPFADEKTRVEISVVKEIEVSQVATVTETELSDPEIVPFVETATIAEEFENAATVVAPLAKQEAPIAPSLPMTAPGKSEPEAYTPIAPQPIALGQPEKKKKFEIEERDVADERPARRAPPTGQWPMSRIAVVFILVAFGLIGGMMHLRSRGILFPSSHVDLSSREPNELKEEFPDPEIQKLKAQVPAAKPEAIEPTPPPVTVVEKKTEPAPAAPVAVQPAKPEVDRNGFWHFPVSAEPNAEVEVVITGASGRILDLTALNLKMTMKLNRSSVLELDPQGLGAPEGEYQVQIFKSGRLLRTQEKKITKDSREFERKLIAHRKMIVFDQQQERRNLLKSIDGLTDFLDSQKNVWGKPLTTKSKNSMLRALNTISRPELKRVKQGRNLLMYSSGWLALSQQYDDVIDYVQSGGTRKPAQATRFDVEALKKKASLLRSQVSQMSLSR